MDHFLDLDFFQNKCSILVKHLYIIYSFCGTFCHENYVRKPLGCVVLIHFCISYLCCIIPQLFVLRDQNFRIQNKFSAAGFAIFIQVSVTLALMFYWKKLQFHRMFDMMNEYPEGSAVTLELNDNSQYMKETNIMKVHFRTYIYGGIYFMLLYLIKAFIGILKTNEGQFQVDPEMEFLIPYFCNGCNSTTRYFLALNSSFIYSVPIPMIYFGSLMLFVLLSMHLKNRAIILQNTIRYYSGLTFECLEKSCEEEEQELEKPYPSSFRLREIDRQRERYIQEFGVKLRDWIRIHQTFIGCLNQYRICAKNILELLMFNSSMCVTFIGYFISRFVIDDENFIYDFLPYIAVNLFFLLVCCKLGNMVNDATEIISDAIYSTPWYYLPAKEQKVILIYLTLSQKNQGLSIFNIFSLNLELVPGILNEAYNYIQIMRLLAMRAKK